MMQRYPQPVRFSLTSVVPHQQQHARAGAAGPKPIMPVNMPGLGGSRPMTPAEIAALGGQVIPLYPNVRLKPLPFYDIVDEIQKPTTLLSRVKTYFKFNLTPKQATDIAMSRDTRPDAKHEYRVQIQLRFCYLDTTCDQGDKLPPQLVVTVNGTHAQLPDYLPTRRGMEPRRPDLPIDVTMLCRISATLANHVEISWGFELGRAYCVSVKLVKRLTSDILLQRLKQTGYRHQNYSKALIAEKLGHDGDTDVAATSLRVSLMCPLGKMRMELPSRARLCTHLQCFDAKTFLMMNEKKARWMCPVCDKSLLLQELYIDGLFVEILGQTDSDEIEFLKDGSWNPVKEEEKSNHTEKSSDFAFNALEGLPTEKPNNEELICLISDDEEDTVPAIDTPPTTNDSPLNFPPPNLSLPPSLPNLSPMTLTAPRFAPMTLPGSNSAPFTLAPPNLTIQPNSSLQQVVDKTLTASNNAESTGEPQLALVNSQPPSTRPNILRRRSSRTTHSSNSDSVRTAVNSDSVRIASEDVPVEPVSVPEHSFHSGSVSDSSSSSSSSGSDWFIDSKKAGDKSIPKWTKKKRRAKGARKSHKNRGKSVDTKLDTDSDSSIDLNKNSAKKKSKPITSDSENERNIEPPSKRKSSKSSDTASQNEKTQNKSKSPSKHKPSASQSAGKVSSRDGRGSDSDTDIYIPISNRNRTNVIESDENSSDTDTSSETPKGSKSSNLGTRKFSVSSAKLNGKLQPVVKLIDIAKCKNYNITSLKVSEWLNNINKPEASKKEAYIDNCDITTSKTDLDPTKDDMLKSDKDMETMCLNEIPDTTACLSEMDFSIMSESTDYDSNSSGSLWGFNTNQKKKKKKRKRKKKRAELQKKKQTTEKALEDLKAAREKWLKKNTKR